MIYNITKVVALTCCFYACGLSNEKEINSEIHYLSQSKMVEILVDLNVLESWHTYIQTNFPSDSLNSPVLKGYYLDIMKNKEVTYDSFRQSLSYYQSQKPEQYNQILDSVNVKIGELLISK